MPFIKVEDGTQLYYKDWGQGRPVVLVHGWPLDADMWEFQASTLAYAGYRVIAYDRRGFGRSDQPWTGYDYDTMSDDLAAVMRALALQDAALVGFSMGGGEIARYMSRHGGAGVSKAALISSICPFLLQTDDHPDGAPKSLFDGIVDGLEQDRAHFLDGFLKKVFGVGLLSSPVSSEALQWMLNTAMLASPKATIDCVRAFGETDLRGDMSAFKVPTLIVHGDSDQTVPIDISGKVAARMIAGSQLIVYEGAPHAVPVTHAKRLNEDLLAFLTV